MADMQDDALRKILLAPMRSQISTADIVTGMWSSTALEEKIHDIKAWAEAYADTRALEARIDELENQIKLEWNAMNSKIIADRIVALRKAQEQS